MGVVCNVCVRVLCYCHVKHRCTGTNDVNHSCSVFKCVVALLLFTLAH